jgi:hypothetical protein
LILLAAHRVKDCFCLCLRLHAQCKTARELLETQQFVGRSAASPAHGMESLPSLRNSSCSDLRIQVAQGVALAAIAKHSCRDLSIES